MNSILSIVFWGIALVTSAQVDSITNRTSLVDYEAFKQLVLEVERHRSERIVSIEKFNSFSDQENTIILDTRSKEMFDAKHVKGAIHLNFSDFNQFNLRQLIPDTNTRILIYCNNNFADDRIYFTTKAYYPNLEEVLKPSNLTLALNIPTYINLYGYGYKNVYELGELLSVFDGRVQFEGTSVNAFGN